MKKFLVIALSCLLLILACTSSLNAFADANESSGIYRIYSPIHEISLLNRSDKLSVISEILNFKLGSGADDCYSHKLSSTYLISNTESSTTTKIVVPFQGTYKDIDLNGFSLTVNGETLAPTQIYLDKTTNFTKSYYHPQFNKNGYRFDSYNLLEHLSYSNNYYGFDISNEPIHNWAYFGKTTINVESNTEFRYVSGDSFDLKKAKNLDYTFSGNLSDKESYTIFFATKKPPIGFPTWLIIIQVIGSVCVMYLMTEAVLLLHRSITKRKGKNGA